MIIRSIYESGKESKKVVFSFRNGKTIVECLSDNDEVVITKQFKEKLRLESERKTTNDNFQHCIAVHESGHFVVYTSLFGKMPEKLCSKTTNKEKGGFLMHDDDEFVNSYEYLIKRIKVSFGGYVAEEMVFGEENRTIGAVTDLRNATEIASRIVRDYGMGGWINTSTYYTEPSNCRCGHVIKENDDTEINEKIKEILQMCYDDVKEILSNPEWKKMLKESSLYLCEHSTMPKKKMKEIYEKVDKKTREVTDKSTYYRDKIKAL